MFKDSHCYQRLGNRILRKDAFIMDEVIFSASSLKLLNVSWKYSLVQAMEGTHCGWYYYGSWYTDILNIASLHVWFENCKDKYSP